MMKSLLYIILLFFYSASIQAQDKEPRDRIQREIQPLDQRLNRKGSMQMSISNMGQVGNDIDYKRGSLIWPGFSETQYLYGSGILLTCKKKINGTSNFMYEYSFDMNTGSSNMVPGIISEGDNLNPTLRDKNQVYSSLDYNMNGKPVNVIDSINWPIWVNPDQQQRNFGRFIKDNFLRNKNTGMIPLYNSDEDIFSVFKDTDLSRYTETHGDTSRIRSLGYPLKIQYRQNIYLHNNPEAKDAFFVYYEAENMSQDSLKSIKLNFLFNLGITSIYHPFSGDDNDRAIIKEIGGSPYFSKMFVCWSDSSKYEAGIEMGYMGIALIMTPKMGEDSNPEFSPLLTDIALQTGLGNMGYIPYDLNVYNSELLENLLSQNHTTDNTAGEKRLFLSTREFNLFPGKTLHAAAMVVFAKAAKGKKPTGDDEDMQPLITKAKQAAEFFYNGMLTDVNEITPIQKPFEIYPQPAQSELNVILYEKFEPLYEIYDINGKRIKFGALNDSKTSIDVSSLTSGAYWLRLNNGERPYLLKFIVSSER